MSTQTNQEAHCLHDARAFSSELLKAQEERDEAAEQARRSGEHYWRILITTSKLRDSKLDKKLNSSDSVKLPPPIKKSKS